MVKFPFKIRLTPTELVNTSPMKVLLNSNLIDTPLPFETSNRAFQYGDGIFETIWIHQGIAPLLDYHKRRVAMGAEKLKLEVHPSRLKFLEENIETLRQFNYPEETECVAKLMVWRHASDKPGYSPGQSSVETLLTIRPKSASKLNHIHLGISEHAQVHYSRWSAAKTLNSLPYVMAAHECLEGPYDDLLLTSTSGEIAEATSANIWVRINGSWHTPRLASGCVSGVMRAYMLEEYADDTSDREIATGDLLNSEGILLSFATGITVVDRFNNKPIPTYDSEAFRSRILEGLNVKVRT